MTSVLEPIVYGAVGFFLCRRAEARTRTFLEVFPVKLSIDYGRGNESERGLLVDKIAITPEVVLALEGTASLKWHVQSTDVDDRQEFLSLDESLIRAGARACERHHVVNTGSDKWIEQVREITAGKGVDLAFDPVAGPSLEQIAQIVREEGTIFVYGALSPEPTPFPLFAALGRNLTIRGYTLLSIVKNPDRLGRARRWVYDQLSAGKLHPVIARTFPLSDIVEAHRYMESNEQIGKIVVTV